MVPSLPKALAKTSSSSQPALTPTTAASSTLSSPRWQMNISAPISPFRITKSEGQKMKSVMDISTSKR